MLSSEQVGFYRENGYLAVPGVVGRERVAAAAAALGQLIERSRQVRASDAVYDLEDAHRPDNPRVRRIKEPHRVDPIFAELLADPAITDMVVQLIGPDLRYEHTKLNIKPSRGGEPVEWHQDWAFYPHSNDDILEVGVMLEDCTLENGPHHGHSRLPSRSRLRSPLRRVISPGRSTLPPPGSMFPGPCR